MMSGRRGRLVLDVWMDVCVDVRLMPLVSSGLWDGMLWVRRNACRMSFVEILGWGVEIDDETSEFVWNNVDREEEAMTWRVESTRGAVGRVEGGVNVPRDEDCVFFSHSLRNSSEHSVGLGVSAPDEEFRRDGFRPSDFSSVALPFWEKFPGLPFVTDNNAQVSS